MKTVALIWIFSPISIQFLIYLIKKRTEINACKFLRERRITVNKVAVLLQIHAQIQINFIITTKKNGYFISQILSHSQLYSLSEH